MDIHQNIPLSSLTTMKLGGPARFLAEAHTPTDVATLWSSAKAQHTPVLILGGGSNLIAKDEGYNGLVIRIRIPGFEVIADDLNTTTIRIGAGENWDQTVKRTVDMNLTGIEAMSGIPGTTGACPVQNVGAYGQEIADTLVSLEAFDTTTGQFATLQAADCNFSYRSSIFRTTEMGRYIITSVTLKLSKNIPTPPFYEALQKYFDERSITLFTAQTVRDAVLAIRADKLPDPTDTPNTGSFFKNAIIESWQADELRKKYPDVKTFDMADGRVKVPTGWLIETAGLKGKTLHGMRVHDKNALVLINESATSYADLAAARDEIIGVVRDTFQILIEQEPLEV